MHETEDRRATRALAIQRTEAGTYRKQPVDPVTGRRVSITGSSPEAVLRRANVLSRARDEIRFGERPIAQVRQEIAVAVHGAVTVADVWATYVATKVEGDRGPLGSAWSRHLAPRFGGKSPYELTRSEMTSWAAERTGERKDGKLAASSVRWHYDVLAAAFNLAIDEGRLSHLPWGKWRPASGKGASGERQWAGSIEELTAIVLAARRHDERRQAKKLYGAYAPALLIASLCGMRQGELAGLAWDHVDVDTQTPSIVIEYQRIRERGKLVTPDDRPMAPTKGRKVRHLALHEGAADALRWQRDQLKARGWYRPDGPVFPCPRSHRWHVLPVVIPPSFVRKWAREANLPFPEKWSTHSARHTFVSLEILGSGGDLRATMQRSGHSSVDQLERYMHEGRRGAPSRIADLPTGRLLGAPPAVVDVRELPERAEVVEAAFEDDEDDEIGALPLAPLADLARTFAARAGEIEDERQKRDEERADRYRDQRKTRITDEGEMRRFLVELSDEELVRAGTTWPTAVTEGSLHLYREAYGRVMYQARKTGPAGAEQKAAAGLAGRRASQAWKGAFGRLRADELRKRGLTVDARAEQNARRATKRRGSR